MKSSLSPTLKISRRQRKLSSVILPNTRGILNCKILPNLPLEKQMFVSLLKYSLPPFTKKVSMWTCGVCPWVKTVRKSSVKLYFSFVLFSVHFKLHDHYRENRQTPHWLDWGDPKKRKHFWFEVILSGWKVKAKFSLVTNIFRSVRSAIGITPRWFICF